MRQTLAIAALLLLSTAHLANASEMRYTPVNPNFGGFPANGGYLLSNADVQNQHKPDKTNATSGQNFASTITNSLLNRIAFNIADQIYGENAADSGHFVLNDTLLDFRRENGQIIVNIKNSTTGETTTLELPETNLAP